MTGAGRRCSPEPARSLPLPCAAVGRRTVLAAGMASLLGLSGCGGEPPIRIGLLSGAPDLDIPNAEDGRNGAVLAVEQRNAGGGVRRRELELVVKDVGPGAQVAKAAGEALLASGVDAIVGPFTSAVAAAVLPLVNAARTLMLSPTASASQLAGLDDYLVRLSPTARDAGIEYAKVLYRRGQRRVALAVAIAEDGSGSSYTRSWRDAFVASFRALGGTVVAESGYAQGTAGLLGDVVRGLLAQRPDGLLLVGGTAEVARMVQQARKLAPGVPVAAAESAANASLLELGGRAAEGVVTAQLYNLADASPRYQRFQAAFRARFALLPGYHAVAAYDAITVLADAMALQRGGESLKSAVLRNSPYQGLMQPITFDQFGDVSRALNFVVVRAGRFEQLP